MFARQILLTIFILSASFDLAANDAVFDVAALTATPLDTTILKSSEANGIVTEEVPFHSEMDGTNRVDIFAFFAYPKGATNLPAFIWNQGVMATFAAANKPKHLTLMPNWDHGLPPIQDEQVFAWLDTHLKGGPAFNEVGPVHVATRARWAIWEFSGPRQITTGELIISYGKPGNWASRYWVRANATIKDNRCEAPLPHDA